MRDSASASCSPRMQLPTASAVRRRRRRRKSMSPVQHMLHRAYAAFGFWLLAFGSRLLSDEPRTTSHEPRTTNHELRVTNHELRVTSYRDAVPVPAVVPARLGSWIALKRNLKVPCGWARKVISGPNAKARP